MKEYFQRVSDKVLLEHLESKGAVLIEGAKWCGKTTSAKHIAKSVIEMDRPDMTEQYQQMARIKPSNLLEGEVPHLIDEWQIAPKLWDAVRFEVDHRKGMGQFILTGSAVPPDDEEIFHSGTGRFAWIKMRPMSLFESGESTGEISLKALFDQPEQILAAEMIREKILRLLNDEVPHGVAVTIESMKERDDKDLLDISAVIYCERDSHKGIIIGKNGAMLKKIASSARYELEKFFQIQVNLKCFVKVKEDWRNKEGLIRSFGLSE